MKLILFLFLCFLNIFNSCNRQVNNSSEILIERFVQKIAGDTVSSMGNSIWIIFQASNGVYWFGSDTSGVYKYDGKTIINYKTNDGLCSNRIRGIQEDKHGNIYFSTLDGISKFNGQHFTTLTALKSQFPNDGWELNPDDLWFSILGKNGEKGPYRYDGTFLYQLEFPKHYLADAYFKRFPNNSWSPYEVYYIYKDRKGIMWFGTSNFGICRFDGNTLSWLYEDHLTNVPNGGSFGIRSIIEDVKGAYWFCNTQYRYHISPNTIHENGYLSVKYQKDIGIEGLKSEDGTKSIYFMSAVEDKGSNLWLATYSEGVFKYNGKNIMHYAIKEGTKDITVFSIYCDRSGDLWLGTHEAGAFKFNGTAFEKFRPGANVR